MHRTTQLIVGAFLCLSALPPNVVEAAGGTVILAKKGQKTYVRKSWPQGVDGIVNDESRTKGWNSWFSEWPNDVQQYAFEAKSTKDINRLIAKLSSLKTELKQVRLSYLGEPKHLGRVTNLPKDNGIPVVFSIGDQTTIDSWFERVRKPFGVMEFNAAPIAVPPTLTIFVRHKAVRLDDLKVPKGVTLSAGYVPTVFHRFNTKQEQQQQAKVDALEKGRVAKIDKESRETFEQIVVFIKDRER